LALLGLVALWPRGDAPDLGVQPNTYVDATVTAIHDGMCDAPELGAPGQCLLVEAHLTSGDDSSDDVTFQVRAGVGSLANQSFQPARLMLAAVKQDRPRRSRIVRSPGVLVGLAGLVDMA
jgi:hypothetical protein